MSGIHGGMAGMAAGQDVNHGVAEQIECVEKSACALSEELDYLFQRLVPATLNVPEPPGPNLKDGSSPPRCEMAQRLCGVDMKLNHLCKLVARQKEMLDI